MKRLVVASALSAAVLGIQPAGLTASASPAAVAERADSTVTIRAENIDLSGTVRSARRVCKEDRKVIVIKQRGERGGGDDQVVGNGDLTELQDGVGVWETGNMGEEGRFYAKVRRTAECAADTSRTITATRADLQPAG